jgi:hypothetical protein
MVCFFKTSRDLQLWRTLLKGEALWYFLLALQPPWALASNFQFRDHFTNGRTPWTSDQLVARPLPKHRTTQTQNKHIHIPNIHVLCGIRTHHPGFRASEDSSCLRPLGYRDRPWDSTDVKGGKVCNFLSGYTETSNLMMIIIIIIIFLFIWGLKSAVGDLESSLIYVLVVTICMCSINQITNPIPRL